jgi:hypothetical protein
MIVHHAPEQLVNGPKGHVPLIKVTLHCTSTEEAAYIAETMRMVNDNYAPDVYESEHVVVCYARPPSYWEHDFRSTGGAL